MCLLFIRLNSDDDIKLQEKFTERFQNGWSTTKASTSNATEPQSGGKRSLQENCHINDDKQLCIDQCWELMTLMSLSLHMSYLYTDSWVEKPFEQIVAGASHQIKNLKLEVILASFLENDWSFSWGKPGSLRPSKLTCNSLLDNSITRK